MSWPTVNVSPDGPAQEAGLRNGDVIVRDLAARLRDESGNVIGAIETLQDITEKEELQVQLQQSQKMEAVGTLAAGMRLLKGPLLGLFAGPEVRFTARNDDGPIALSTDGRLLAQGMSDFVVYDIPKKRWRYRLGIRADARQGADLEAGHADLLQVYVEELQYRGVHFLNGGQWILVRTGRRMDRAHRQRRQHR